jgi:PAS domain S-box-containing protein
MSDHAQELQNHLAGGPNDEPGAELYREIFTHANDAIAIIDLESHYLEQNAAHRNLMGYADEELYGKTPALHMGADSFALIARELVEKGEYRGEVTSHSKNGESLQIELSAFAMKNAAGAPICYVRIKRDISARKQSEEALRRSEAELAKVLLRERSARAEAEQASRLKDEFLATVSHELRTPLNAMMGWARMLRSGRLDAESREHALEVIERNAWAQKQIIEDILDVSRIITGKLQLSLAPVDLRSVVDAALDAVRPALEAKEIQIKKEMDPRVRIIAGDSDRLQQVIWNLLSNAAKFTPAGGQIELYLRQISNNIQIQVSDTGPGIDPTFLPFVFERFRQADGSTTRTHGGLGLGLAIVRHLVELHGGSIKAENRNEGQGGVLTVSLPLPTGELRIEDVPGAFASDAEALPETPDLTGVRILVVDDEADALDLITIDLAACGAKVTAFANAAEALRALEQSQFDLLISDIGMPDQDGYELIRRVRAAEAGSQSRKLPAVALTAYARVQDRLRALIAGYDTHVAKPLESGELVTVVASLVGRLVKK